MPAIPFVVYKMMSVILSKGGWTLLLLVAGLVSQGVLKTRMDIVRFLASR